MAEVQLVFSSDRNYFPLAKGLVLSLQRTEALSPGRELAFIDLGCSPSQLQWLAEKNIRVTQLDAALLGSLAQQAPGHLRALVLRPFLPQIFPDARAFLWLDSDIWIQNGEAIHLFAMMVLAHADKIFICPEWHYSYVSVNYRFVEFHIDFFAPYYRTLYDESTAKMMAGRPLLNAGLFSLAASNPLWEKWKSEVQALYARNYGDDDSRMRHLAEQTALNVLIARDNLAIPVDPLFNYMCMYGLPFRDGAGVVRVALPPNTPVGVVHLANWRTNGRIYLDHGLLFDSGKYLTDEDRGILQSLVMPTK